MLCHDLFCVLSFPCRDLESYIFLFLYQELDEAVKLFESDPYGCNSKKLQEKHAERNPFMRTIPYTFSCPEVAPLLEYCETTIYPDPLPWDAH